MNKKKWLLFTFILSSVLGFSGALMKLNHVAFANAILCIGSLTGLFFLFYLIYFLVKAKEG